MKKSNQKVKPLKNKPSGDFGSALSYAVFIITAVYWLLLFIGFIWSGAYTDFYWLFTFAQYGLTILITALIMLTTVPIACRNVARPLSAMTRILAPFSAFCVFQATNFIVRLISPDQALRAAFSWFCFALILAVFVVATIILKKFKKLPAIDEQKLFEKRKKLFSVILIAEFILSFVYVCIICTILPREISLFLRYQ
ncbi:hypothetical protein IJH97_01955 [Candidatus Saccharibacteria bacterium]|nr:hypothetical protein [Candidatus Saccharibacteria bacterium]